MKIFRPFKHRDKWGVVTNRDSSYDKKMKHVVLTCGKIVRFNKSSEEVLDLCRKIIADNSFAPESQTLIKKEVAILMSVYGKKFKDC